MINFVIKIEGNVLHVQSLLGTSHFALGEDDKLEKEIVRILSTTTPTEVRQNIPSYDSRAVPTNVGRDPRMAPPEAPAAK
jgi:hypothetical protein